MTPTTSTVPLLPTPFVRIVAALINLIWARVGRLYGQAARQAACSIDPPRFLSECAAPDGLAKRITIELGLGPAVYHIGQAVEFLRRWSAEEAFFRRIEADGSSEDYVAALGGQFRGFTLVFVAS